MNDTPSNIAEFTVSELAFAVRRAVEDGFGYVRVRGEVSGFRGVHGSGHAYFSLKDQNAKLDAVIWRGVYQRLKVKPEDGLEVIATGKLTTFPGKSSYQIVVDALEPAGAGALMALLEERRQRLAAEGLFDAARKQLLPALPRVVGVVTSPTGAVIRDILHRLSDRFPLRVIVWPVRVQGETSAAEVAAAIRGFDALPADAPVPRPDVLIVARGGGSLEDLWSFNEEAVVRAAADCSIPLVSAIGHETDTTLLDFVADVRAPTPTAAAELVVPVRLDLLGAVTEAGARLARAASRRTERSRRDLGALARFASRAERLLALPRQRLDTAAARLPRAMTNARDRRAALLAALVGTLARARPAALLAAAAARVQASWGRAERAVSVLLARRDARFSGITPRLEARLVARSAALARERLSVSSGRLAAAVARSSRECDRRLSNAAQLLRSLGYRSVLARGFVILRDVDGVPLRRRDAIAPGAPVEAEFVDGRISLIADGARSRGSRSRRSAGDQNDLFA
jgi:exodeoxyribonuclease VII large subunit